MKNEELNEKFLKAVVEGNIDLAAELLSSGAQLNALTPSGNNALYVSAMRNKKEMFDWLLEITQNGESIDVDNRNVNGLTLMYDTVSQGNFTSYLKALLEHGANPNLYSHDGMTPLIKAIADGKIEEIKILLNSVDTDVNYVIPGTHTTAFLMATTAASGAESLEICKLLIDKGADINAKDINGKNALINSLFKTKQFMKKKEKKEHFELCQYLIEQNIDLDYVSPSGMTAFWIVSMDSSNPENRHLAQLMLDKNIKTDVWHSIGMSGLNSALHSWMNGLTGEEEDKTFLEKVISLGANMNAPDEEGNTPAIIGFSNPNARQLTLDLGGDVNAILYKKDANKKLTKISALAIVASAGDKQKDIVDQMIAKGVTVSYDKDPELKYSSQPIVCAILSSAVGICESLLNTNQIDPNVNIASDHNYKGISLLSILLSNVNGSFSQVLERKNQLEAVLKAKEINEKNGVTSPLINNDGFEAIKQELDAILELEKSLENNKKQMFDLLISYGVDVNFVDERGFKPLFYCSSPQYIDWVLEAGADFFTTSKEGDNLLISSIKNDREVVPYILEKFKEGNHPSVNSLFYDLAFVETKNDYERKKVEAGIIKILSEEDQKTLVEIINYKKTPPKNPGDVVEDIKTLSIENINYQDEDGNSPILVATSNDNAFLVSLYSKLGGDINLANNHDETPLMHAIAIGNVKMVEFFIKGGADLNAKTSEGKQVIDFAEELENKEILEAVKIALGHGISEGQLSGFKKLKR